MLLTRHASLGDATSVQLHTGPHWHLHKRNCLRSLGSKLPKLRCLTLGPTPHKSCWKPSQCALQPRHKTASCSDRRDFRCRNGTRRSATACTNEQFAAQKGTYEYRVSKLSYKTGKIKESWHLHAKPLYRPAVTPYTHQD